MSDLSLLALRAANAARDVEWINGRAPLTLVYRAAELGGEAGEACNVLKKLERERLGLPGSRATIAQAAEELADVVICADLAAMDLAIDLGAAVAAKFNATSSKLGFATRLGLAVELAETAAALEHALDENKRLRERLRELENPPAHRYWRPGEADCPGEIKAGNGELHTLRCKVCGLDNPRNQVCRGAPAAAELAGRETIAGDELRPLHDAQDDCA